MKVFINPGHEPTLDPGACANGLREADVALAIGKLTAAYLRDAGCEVKLYQVDGLDEICEASNSWRSDIFVSIHCNAAENVYAHGTETFYCYGAGAGRLLADCIQSQILHALPVEDRHVCDAGFAVLRGTDCPAVLVETAFVTNESDAELLKTCQDDFARAIARGVTDFAIYIQPDVVDRRP